MKGFEQIDVLQDGHRQVGGLVWLGCCVHHIFCYQCTGLVFRVMLHTELMMAHLEQECFILPDLVKELQIRVM